MRCVIATTSIVLLTAACGGPAAGPARQNGPVAFARCMRSNGVPNWPDPGSNGAFDKSKLTSQQLGASDAKVQAAQHVCSHLLPNGGNGPNAAQLQQIRAQALTYSRCVRSHDVPSFPDPDSTGRIPERWPGVDQGSRSFRAANQACGKYRPPYIPSNAAYDDYLRSHG